VTVVDTGPASDENRVWLRRTALTDAWAVLRGSGQAFAGHWPVLLSLCFFGVGARALINQQAVHAAHVNAIFGMLVFLAGPTTLILALVLAMRTLRPSLPYLSTVGAGADARWRSWRTTLAGIGSVAVPFVGVYYGSGYLADDATNYYYDVFMYDPLHKASLPEKLTVTGVIVVAVALGLRILLAQCRPLRQQRWLGIPRAYLEIVWITATALLIHPMYEAAKEWAFNRRATHWLAAARDQVYGLPHNPADWFGTAIGSVDVIIGLPIAWLVVGAVVYGRQIEAEAEASGGFLRRMMYSLLGQGFGPLRDGVYLVGRSGLAAVLGFCGMFLLSQTVAVWMFEAERVIIGPRDFGFWVPASGITSAINSAVQLAVVVCLVAGATDRTLWIESHHRQANRLRIPAQRSELTVTQVEQAATSSV
jgi:hypothetical protein